MTIEAQQNGNTTDAREASTSRVQTSETILSSLATPASPEAAQAAENEKKDGGEQKPKQSAQDRIRELAAKRKEAEAKADAKDREAADLRRQLEALRTQAKPIEQSGKPARSDFKSEESYFDALTDWKADQRIAKREREQQEARSRAEQEEIAQAWDSKQKKTIERIPDWTEVVGASNLHMPEAVTAAILESDVGPEIAYFFALNQNEAKRIFAMRPIQAVKAIDRLEKELMEDDAPEQAVSETKKQSKAPAPINPVKGAAQADPGKSLSFEEYRAKRLREKQQK